MTALQDRAHILVVDDDGRLRALIQRFLMGQGYLVSTAFNTHEAEQLMRELNCDLIVLDDMMPGETGFSFARRMREERQSNIPILILTARGEVEDRLEGLETGADDYMSKPFEPKELALRIQAILRRAQKNKTSQSEFSLGRWRYHMDRDELTRDDEIVRLTEMEAGLMRILAQEAGNSVSRDVLAESSKGMVNDRTIDVQVTRLRRRFEDDSKNPRYLVTVRGEGYMLLPDPKL